jgi:hypothetical protein
VGDDLVEGRGLTTLLEGYVAEFDPVPLDQGPEIGMVGHDDGDVADQVTGAPAVEHVGQAMVLPAGQHHNLPALLGVAEMPAQLEPPGHVGESAGELVAVKGKALGQDLDPLEEVPRGQVAVLSRFHHPSAVGGDEPGDGGHDAGAVRAGDREDEATHPSILVEFPRTTCRYPPPRAGPRPKPRR